MQQPSQFRSPTQKPSQSTTTLKTSRFWLAHSRFRPPAQKKAIFDHNTKTKSNSIPPQKIKPISTPPMQSGQFDPLYKIKSTSTPQHKNKLFSIDTLKPSIFEPSHKTMSIQIQTTRSSQAQSQTLKSNRFRPPTHKN